MAKVLTESSSVTCNHSGTVSLSGSSKLVVSSGKVLLKAGIGPSISACTTVPDTSKGLKKCKNVAGISAGPATKLTVAGAGVMLDTLAGTADGVAASGGGTVSASGGQTKLTAT